MASTTGSEDQSWKVALDAQKKIGYVPIAFSQAIRILVNDHALNQGELRAVSKYQIVRLFRGPSFKAMLFYGTKALANDFVDKQKSVTVGDLISVYTPLDLAAMISSFFLGRRMKKMCGEELWGKIAPHFAREGEIGAQVGVAIPSNGFAPGLLIGALRNISHALLSLEQPKSYVSYRKKVETLKKSYAPEVELELWQTTSAQVSSLLLSALGFRSGMGELMASALTTQQRAAEIKDDEVRRFRLAHLWSDCFLQGRPQPLEKLDGKYFPFEQDRKRAEAGITKIDEGGLGWLLRDAADLTPEKAPQMFTKAIAPAEAEIPDELKDVFSMKELTEMDERAFDALIDQIDAENTAAAEKKRDDRIATKDLKDLEHAL